MVVFSRVLYEIVRRCSPKFIFQIYEKKTKSENVSHHSFLVRQIRVVSKFPILNAYVYIFFDGVIILETKIKFKKCIIYT